MARCLRCNAGNEWISGSEIFRPDTTRELVLRLNDELRRGVKYDRKRNVYTLVWTARELRNARRRAKRLLSRINIE